MNFKKIIRPNSTKRKVILESNNQTKEMFKLTQKKISPEELYEKMQKQEKIMLLDVRAEEKYNDYHIEDSSIESLNIPKTGIFNLEENNDSIDALPKEKEIIVACTTGNSAAKCAAILAENEYDTVVLEGGITAWKEYLKTKSN